MAKNKKTHHRPGPGKPRGATYAQVLAHKAAVRKGLEQAPGTPRCRYRRIPIPSGPCG